MRIIWITRNRKHTNSFSVVTFHVWVSNNFNFYYYREIDFVNETVRTLAGNGSKGSDYRGGDKGTNQVRLQKMKFEDPLQNHIHISFK